MSSLALPRARAVPLAYAYGLVALVGATVLAVSAYYLYRLALAVKMPAELAWSLPVALDAGAAFGTVCWIIGDEQSETRRFGRAFALSCLAGTLAGNGLAHLLDFHVIGVDPWLAVAVCSVYPVILFAIVHLVLLLRREQSATAGEAVEDASPIDQPPASAAAEALVMNQPLAVSADTSREVVGDASREVATTSSGVVGSPLTRRRRRSTPEQRYRWIHGELDGGREVSGGRIERHFGTRNGARELRRVLAEREAAATEGEVA